MSLIAKDSPFTQKGRINQKLEGTRTPTGGNFLHKKRDKGDINYREATGLNRLVRERAKDRNEPNRRWEFF